jgi:hypothetical protein
VKVYFREDMPVTDDVQIIKLDKDIVQEIRTELEKSGDSMVEVSGMGEWLVGYLPKQDEQI